MSSTYPIIQFVLSTGILEFSRSQVLSAELVEETTSISTEIPVNTINFKIKTSDSTFSMFSNSALTERLPVLAYESVDGTPTLLGKFYLDTWKNLTEYITEFSAIDIVGVMDNIDFDGAFWETDTLVSTILAQILVPINVTYSLDASFVAATLKGWASPGNYRDVLQQICFAIGATVITSRTQSLLIVPITTVSQMYDHRIDREYVISNQSSIEKLPLVSRIEVVSHNYTQDIITETFFDQYLTAGSYKIVYDKPYTGIIITGPGYTQSTLGTEGGDEVGTENGDQIEAGGAYVSGSNSTYLTISSAGQVTFTGTPWIDSKHSFIYNNAGVTNKNTIVISDATLVDVDNAQAILDLVTDYYEQTYVQSVKLLPSEVAVGEIVLSETIYDTQILAFVQKARTDLTKGFISELVIRGIVPVYVQPETNPTRRARTGVAISGADLTKNNLWRNYA